MRLSCIKASQYVTRLRKALNLKARDTSKEWHFPMSGRCSGGPKGDFPSPYTSSALVSEKISSGPTDF